MPADGLVSDCIALPGLEPAQTAHGGVSRGIDAYTGATIMWHSVVQPSTYEIDHRSPFNDLDLPVRADVRIPELHDPDHAAGRKPYN